MPAQKHLTAIQHYMLYFFAYNAAISIVEYNYSIQYIGKFFFQLSSFVALVADSWYCKVLYNFTSLLIIIVVLKVAL